jgi:hypothetical protein
MGDKEDSPERIDQPPDQQEVTFNYFKSQFFRVIHADGAWGGVSPRGDIHISFYNERIAIPDKSRLRISESGTAVRPEEFESTSAIVREVEVDVVVDLTTAIQLREWLNNKIKTLETIIKMAQEPQLETRDDINDEKMA